MGSATATHLVQFYTGAEQLAQTLGGMFTEPLLRGETVVAVADAEHRAALDEAFTASGVNLAAELRSGRYLRVDVGEALDAVMAPDGPSPERFRSTVADTLARARRRTGTVHVYGEMAGVLAARGDLASALRVESLSHDMLAVQPCRLVCGYPRDVVRDDDAFDTICGTHDVVVAARETPGPTLGATLTLPVTPTSAMTAARTAHDMLTAWGADAETVTDAGALVSEFVAGAARHRSSQVTLEFALDRAKVTVAMTDADRSWPPRIHETDLVSVGRAYALLSTLARSWGVEALPAGVRIWATLAPRRPS